MQQATYYQQYQNTSWKVISENGFYSALAMTGWTCWSVLKKTDRKPKPREV